MSPRQIPPNPQAEITNFTGMETRMPVIITIVLLIFIFDRVEFLYYGLSQPEKLTSFWIKGEPIRADAYWYFASLRVQYMIFAAILYLLVPEFKTALALYFWVSVLYFIEYFLTYNEPITRLHVFGPLYVPISVTLLKFFALCYLLFDCLRKYIFYGRL